ncbi:gamma-tubulin complex component 4-like [Amphibalanus amphitrite]|uniref:gamma-tubulin complex component 4-like n=1 Tax=Amphibalanus amphitrite TaxID=1232801 RepID=UPI001C913664|nr:gamma-tubulin complex component 4-like [Amphibalanus amphitrite]XP_043231100.1 gamma-tubulin complex component 4-like [Amphibalanus amphitrite]XP_043231101.1 gamma-tubulin complex component 4-like [Amphibalanus amphitrite]XP_043231102.1 gamma-tubulin complex component 4-like [Amphibalanus amphitrite]
MLHELLLALEGCPGSLFTLKEDDSILVDGSLPFFNPSERSLLNELCSLGTWYRHVRTFIERQQAADESPGQYVRALCGALDQATADYEACLQRLEEDLLADPDLGLAYVYHAVQPHAGLLRALSQLLAELTRLGATGCRVLDVLQRHTAAAVGDERRHLQRVLQRCHRVLLAQLSAWLLYGLLSDAGGEFFLRERSVSETDGAALGRLARAAAAAERQQTPLVEFELDPELLPSYLPLRLCQSVLFVGNSIQMCRQRVEQRVEGAAGVPLSGIVSGHESQFAAEFEALSAEPTLSPLRLERLVNRIKTLVAKHLWKVIVVEAGLSQHLSVMKDFFLMGRGTLYQELFIECDPLLRAPPKAHIETDINEAFAVACGRVGLEDDSVLESLYLTLAPGPEGASGWDRLRINYAVRWPLHLLYTPTVLAGYNDIFSFLLLVKRTQLMLERLWADQMDQKSGGGAGRMATHQLRAHMSFLVNNLQYYLHVDVLESEHSRLQAAVAAAEDYEQLRHAHDCFLTAVSSQCFLQSAPVSECLRDLLTACQELCLAIPEGRELAPLQQRLQLKSQLLFRILSSLKDQRAGSHLSRLLLRIDFNQFVSRGI